MHARHSVALGNPPALMQRRRGGSQLETSERNTDFVGHVTCLEKTDHLRSLHATVRDARCPQDEFVRSSRRIIRMLLETAMAQLGHENVAVKTPIGVSFAGKRLIQPQLYAVSVPRSGDAMEQELRELCPSTKVGKILVQRDPVTKLPSLLYTKLPPTIANKEVLLLDPMMATAGTAKLAISVLIDNGVSARDIVYVNFLTCPTALERLFGTYPEVRVVTGWIDDQLTDEAFMLPGLGDFGDRFFGTTVTS